jgi:hypothetical protein
VALKAINSRPTDGATVTIVKIAAGITVGKPGKTGSMRLIEKIAPVCQIIHALSRGYRSFTPGNELGSPPTRIDAAKCGHLQEAD